MRILLADGFGSWRRVATSLLESKPGWHVIEASDGLEAVLKARALNPDVVLLGIGLPKLNSLEVARQIRQFASNSKIVFASTHDELDYVKEAMNTGAIGYILKASAGGELVRAVEAALQGKRFLSGRLKRINPAFAADAQALHNLDDSEAIAVGQALPGKIEMVRRHEVQFYPDDASFVDRLTGFIEPVLKAEKSAVVVAKGSQRDMLLRKLQARGVDISAAIDMGRYVSLDVAETVATFMVNGHLDRNRFLEVAGGCLDSAAKMAKEAPPQVAACGGCAALLYSQGKAEEAIQLEQLWNEIAKIHDVEILCGYPSRGFDGQEDSPTLRRICAEHSAVFSN